MPSREIEEFARILVEQVRDAAIQLSDMALEPDAEFAAAKRWRKAGRSGNLKPIVSEVIPDVVDRTLFYLLHAIDEDLLKLSFTSSNGKQVDLCADGLGELAGWYAGGNWPSQYSKERFVDDLSHLE